MTQTTCPECGHEFDDEDNEQGLDLPAEGVVGECDGCGTEIRYGEWHVLVESESERVPDGVATSVQVGDPDDAPRLCGPCSDRDPNEFPDDREVAGI